VGHRFDRIVYDALASYQLTKHVTFQATYGVFFTPAQGESLSAPSEIMLDPTGHLVDSTTGLPIDPTDVGFGLEDQPFIANRAEASLVGNYTRDHFSVISRFEHRNFLNEQPNDDVLVAGAAWTHDLRSDLRVGGLISYRHSNEADDELDDTFIGRVDLAYDLAENATIFGAYSHTERLSNVSLSEYSENALTVGLSFNF